MPYRADNDVYKIDGERLLIETALPCLQEKFIAQALVSAGVRLFAAAQW